MSGSGFGYLCAVLLALVFVVAAIAKLRDPAATGRSFEALGVPWPAALARVIPMSEAVIAAALIGVPVVGGLAALASLAFFTTFLLGRLRAGVQAPCACFGAARATPISAVNLVGNSFLIILSLAALLANGPTRPTVADAALVALLFGAEIAIRALVQRRLNRPTSVSTAPG